MEKNLLLVNMEKIFHRIHQECQENTIFELIAAEIVANHIICY